MKSYIYTIIVFLFLAGSVFAQDKIIEELTFEQVIELAQEQSPDAIMAKHQFRADYWQFKSYKAGFLPNLNFSSTLPSFNRAITQNQQDDGSYRYSEEFVNNIDATLSLDQKVPFLGGDISITSDLSRTDLFGDFDGTSYRSTPISIRYSQPVIFHNAYKWERKIEPLKYEEAKKQYISSLEDVSLKAVRYFFDLALAQQNLQVAQINYSNADTLYKIAEGRFNIGTIAENELMQMELSFLNAGSALNSAGVDLEINKARLRSFLGFNEKVDINLIIPSEIPQLTVEVGKALSIAQENNPDMISYNRRIIEAARDVSKARSEKGLKLNLFASAGYTQQAEDFDQVYTNLQDQQGLRLGISTPILDWGQGRGRYKMAQSSQEVIKTTVEQARVDFVQNVYLNVMQFNLQDDQLLIAAKSDTIAQKRYDMTKQRFLIGKVDVLDLNVALSEKDGAKTNYISALRKYWSNFYTLRRITLYDFIKDENLDTDYGDLIN